jgi:predicted small lipoprotein YifL
MYISLLALRVPRFHSSAARIVSRLADTMPLLATTPPASETLSPLSSPLLVTAVEALHAAGDEAPLPSPPSKDSAPGDDAPVVRIPADTERFAEDNTLIGKRTATRTDSPQCARNCRVPLRMQSLRRRGSPHRR